MTKAEMLAIPPEKREEAFKDFSEQEIRTLAKGFAVTAEAVAYYLGQDYVDPDDSVCEGCKEYEFAIEAGQDCLGNELPKTVYDNIRELSDEQLKQALENVGLDVTCGACMGIFFTSFNEADHTCKMPTTTICDGCQWANEDDCPSHELCGEADRDLK